ncbi:hypothetical protein Dimus_010872 [Dionaea muscipula]
MNQNPIFEQCIQWFGLVWIIPSTLDGLFAWWNGVKFKKDKIAKVVWRMLPVIVCWFIWRQKNKVMFNNKPAEKECWGVL